jgi:hypothetical protein
MSFGEEKRRNLAKLGESSNGKAQEALANPYLNEA